MLDRLAILDLETTGMRAGKDRIIEVGCLLVDKGQVTKKISFLINPQVAVNPFIFQLTGIDPYELAKQADFESFATDLYQDLQDRILVAHNSRFDYSFLKAEFGRLGFPFQVGQICTVRLSRKLFPHLRGHGLDKLISRLNIEVKNRHRAYDDAEVIWESLQQWQQMFGIELLKDRMHQILKQPSLPTYLDNADLQNLPESPGVYLMYDQDKTLLYVGKSINIKQRVRSHFYDDLHNFKELKIKQQVSKIDYRHSAGELEALLLESQLVKDLQPIYNHKLLYKKTFICLELTPQQDSYHQVTLSRKSGTSIDPSFPTLLFKTKAESDSFLEKISVEFNLCKKLLGIEHTRSACFGYRLHTCKGACIGKEDFRMYNARLELAINQYALYKWPFPGAVAITEYNQTTNDSAKMIFDQWKFLGKASDSELRSKEEVDFDYDVYSILRQYLRNKIIEITPWPEGVAEG